jgi:hypothetical protein
LGGCFPSGGEVTNIELLQSCDNSQCAENLPQNIKTRYFLLIRINYNLTVALGTKNRQKQTAETCKRHLREKYQKQAGLVEEFISEFEGSDLIRWSSFTDVRGMDKEMLERLDAFFETWLNP